MTGETNLDKLLKTMKPSLQKEEFVFCTLSKEAASNLKFDPLCLFVEAEGVTVICSKVEAKGAGLNFAFPCKMITLAIHSSLEAIGLTAAIAKKLTEAGISANVVAAYFHDHVFVPTDRADEALKLLLEFSE